MVSVFKASFRAYFMLVVLGVLYATSIQANDSPQTLEIEYNKQETSSQRSDKVRILVGSPVYQKPAILQEFLDSLRRLNQNTIALDFAFVDDNRDEVSRGLLRSFAEEVPAAVTILRNRAQSDDYLCNEATHYWSSGLIWKVAYFKDKIIELAREQGYDYLFLIDSDIVLNPRTLEHLVSLKKDIVSEIFWTVWRPNAPLLPQVWLYDTYTQYEVSTGERPSSEEIMERHKLFIEQLKQPGTYEVGGLGACTLISKQALHAGASFKKIKNLTLWGEDRHFCVRALALGLSLFVDTHYPAYHIYRETDLPGVEHYKRENQ
jgi:GT2 family glycosyltransferase